MIPDVGQTDYSIRFNMMVLMGLKTVERRTEYKWSTNTVNITCTILQCLWFMEGILRIHERTYMAQTHLDSTVIIFNDIYYFYSKN